MFTRTVMNRIAVAGVMLAVLPGAGLQPAQSKMLLEPGAYQVHVRIELPNLADNTAVKVSEICIHRVDPAGNPGLVVLSENNPLANCPHSNLQLRGNELSFRIRCPGGNAAYASARFTIGQAKFTGRIDMNMGGKNMTMTEVQAGRRVGECAPRQ